MISTTIGRDDDWQRPYRAANGHLMVQTDPRTTWDAVCADTCDACHGTGDGDDWYEPWYDDGMI